MKPPPEASIFYGASCEKSTVCTRHAWGPGKLPHPVHSVYMSDAYASLWILVAESPGMSSRGHHTSCQHSAPSGCWLSDGSCTYLRPGHCWVPHVLQPVGTPFLDIRGPLTPRERKCVKDKVTLQCCTSEVWYNETCPRPLETLQFCSRCFLSFLLIFDAGQVTELAWVSISSISWISLSSKILWFLSLLFQINCSS